MKPMKFQQLPADQLDDAIVHPDVFVQQKIDGIRAMLQISGNQLTVVGGGGNPVKSTTALPTAQAVEAWAHDTFTLGDYQLYIDGEIVNGTWWMFDLARSPRTDETTPFQHRIAVLQALHRKLNPPEHIRLLPTAKDLDRKRRLVQAIHDTGSEGVILRHRRSSYDWDLRTTHTLKCKLTHTLDCVILDRNIGGPDKMNAVLGLTNSTDELQPVGQCSMIGKPDAQPGDVVEVKYLYAGAGGKLVQPTVLRIRDDKPPADCNTDQLVFVNKNVLTDF